jgi:hypothetical protein
MVRTNSFMLQGVVTKTQPIVIVMNFLNCVNEKNLGFEALTKKILNKLMEFQL